MSQRDAMRMNDDEVAEFLAANVRARVSTLNGDGSPHVVPVTYVMVDGELSFWTDEGSQKVRNLRRDPRIGCLVDEGFEFQDLRAVQLTGWADVVDDPEAHGRVADRFCEMVPEKDRDAARAHLLQLATERVIVSIKPERIVSWDHRKLAGVRPQDIGK